MMRSRFFPETDDAGVALVAAMGVALIGIAVAGIVISQTIMVANDSGRDRIRTIEVHSAEAAIDATMAELEVASPCDAPSFSPMTYGEGTQQAQVTVEIDYYNDDSPDEITCTGGVLDALPNRAEVTATAVSATEVQGVDPVRSVQASLALDPRVSVSNQAAIYSTSSLTTSSGLQLSPQMLDQSADVWIDEGDWYCNVPTNITGSLILPDGGLQFNNGCFVTGDVWLEKNFHLTGADKVKQVVGGDMTVRSGNFSHVPSNDWYIGGNLTVGGTYSTNGRNVITGGTKTFNVGAANITDIEPVGIPYIDYDISDWTALGFVERTDEDMYAELVNDWAITPAQTWRSNPLKTCQYHGWIAEGRPLKLPAVKTVYDLRDCTTTLVNNSFTMELYADTALFVTNFESTGNVQIKSGDGGQHKLWIISPQAGGGHVPGNITSSPELRVLPPVETFWYSPLNVTLKSSSEIIGQVYGGKVSMSSPVKFEYTDVGVPGRSLVSAVQSSAGFVVELLYKREVS